MTAILFYNNLPRKNKHKFQTVYIKWLDFLNIKINYYRPDNYILYNYLFNILRRKFLIIFKDCY